MKLSSLLCISVCGWLLITLVDSAWAQTMSLSPSAHKKLKKAQVQIQAQEYHSALNAIRPLTRSTRPNSLDRAMSWQLIAHIHIQLGKEIKAIHAYEQALEQKVLSTGNQKSLTLSLGQLYLNQQQPRKCIKLLNAWMETAAKQVDANAYLLLAQAYSKSDEPSKAPFFVKQAIEHYGPNNESWYQYLFSLYYELANHEQAVNVLRKMTAIFPSEKRYWQQLASLYLSLKQQDDALTTLQLAWQKDYLTNEKEITNLVALYEINHLPYEAASVLEHALQRKQIKPTFKMWLKAINLFLAAQEHEKALELIDQARTTTRLSEELLILAQLYIAEEEWLRAQALLNDAFAAQPKTLAKYFYLQAVVSYQLGDIENSILHFGKVIDHKLYSRDAKKWIDYLKN